jgi:hypothetical protein
VTERATERQGRVSPGGLVVREIRPLGRGFRLLPLAESVLASPLR